MDRHAGGQVTGYAGCKSSWYRCMDLDNCGEKLTDVLDEGTRDQADKQVGRQTG